MDSLVWIAKKLAPLSALFLASVLVLPLGTLSVAQAAPLAGVERLELKTSYVLKTARDGVVEDLNFELRAGTVIAAFKDTPTELHEVRDEQGVVRFSSTGYVRFAGLLSGPGIDAEKLAQLNKLSGGLYISAAAVQDLDGGDDFKPMEAGAPEAGYLQYFLPSGKPKAGYTTLLKKRFSVGFNGVIHRGALTVAEQTKWDRIYAQLLRVADRSRPSDKELLMMDRDEARRRSILFEKTKVVSMQGAWSIAVWGTAARHGFQNVPCAEFMGEVIRQAYARAGYSHFEDFNDLRKNRLDYANDAAAVEMLAVYLHRAGWIPWDSAEYIPMTGAIAMHRTARTPGHTYMIAGDNGRFILDNGRPQGRDLRTTAGRTIELMYQHGIFFLPPGRTPNRWPVSQQPAQLASETLDEDFP